MKLQFLASAALVLLSAVPSVFSEESSSSVEAKPVQKVHMTGVLDAVTDEVDLFGEEFDAENGKISTAKKSKRSKKSKRNKSNRRRSRRRRSRHNRHRRRSTHRRGMCGRNMRSRDRRTCDSLERQFCRSSRDRRRNNRICRDLGFRTLAEGAHEGSVETYAADSEVFSEDTMEMVDRIVDDIEDDLAYDEDSADEGSADDTLEIVDGIVDDVEDELADEDFFDSEEVLADRGDRCSQGTRDGRNAVRKLFDNDCNNALDQRFTRDVNRMRDRKFSRNTRNWKDKARNECARKAIKKELDRIGRQCRNSGQAADDCNDLGDYAAHRIVEDSGVCPSKHQYGASHSSKNNLKKFRRECRSVGTGSCQGSIRDKARDCGASLNTGQQSRLQRQCRDEVNRLTGRGDNELYSTDTA